MKNLAIRCRNETNPYTDDIAKCNSIISNSLKIGNLILTAASGIFVKVR